MFTGPHQWSNSHFKFFWHSGTLALRSERQSARKSKNLKWWVRPVWTCEHLKCNRLSPLGLKGLIVNSRTVLFYRSITIDYCSAASSDCMQTVTYSALCFLFNRQIIRQTHRTGTNVVFHRQPLYVAVAERFLRTQHSYCAAKSSSFIALCTTGSICSTNVSTMNINFRSD